MKKSTFLRPICKSTRTRCKFDADDYLVEILHSLNIGKNNKFLISLRRAQKQEPHTHRDKTHLLRINYNLY